MAPTLPPLSPRFLVAGDAARGGEARDVEATRSETDAIDASETVGWRETVRRVDRRRRGAPADFVRGAATQQPFTPGGAGWEAAARATARRRDAEARRASASWLAAFEAGVLDGTPRGFAPSPWAESYGEARRDALAEAEASRPRDFPLEVRDDRSGAPWTHDDLMMSALLMGGSDASSADASSASGGSEVGSSDPEAASAASGGSEDDAFDDDVDAVLRSVRVTSRKRDKRVSRTRDKRVSDRDSKASKKKEEQWAVMERLTDVDDAFRREAPEPAMTFPFELDAFQKEAAYRLERGESVFVAAHTSAGQVLSGGDDGKLCLWALEDRGPTRGSCLPQGRSRTR